MTGLLPELSDLPTSGVFDGELVAFADGQPYFPLVCERLLHGDRSVPLTHVIFDLLELDGESMVEKPYRERRAILDELNLGAGPGSSPRRSTTATPCSPPCGSTDSKGWWRSGGASGIGLGSGAG